jgi:hypothetical protein
MSADDTKAPDGTSWTWILAIVLLLVAIAFIAMRLVKGKEVDGAENPATISAFKTNPMSQNSVLETRAHLDGAKGPPMTQNVIDSTLEMHKHLEHLEHLDGAKGPPMTQNVIDSTLEMHKHLEHLEHLDGATGTPSLDLEELNLTKMRAALAAL